MTRKKYNKQWKGSFVYFICNVLSLTHPHVTFSSAFINSIKNNDTRKSAITSKLIIENTWQSILKATQYVPNKVSNQQATWCSTKLHTSFLRNGKDFYIWAWYRHVHNIIIIRFSHRGKWELGFWAFGC